jgi:hypothetical protein
MTEPMLQHEMIDLLYEFEQPFMTMEEILDWAERGFKDYLRELNEVELKARYNRLQSMSENFSEELD